MLPSYSPLDMLLLSEFSIQAISKFPSGYLGHFFFQPQCKLEANGCQYEDRICFHN